MTLTPFRYAGAKNKLLPILTPYLDKILDWGYYCEPFVGGGSVLLDVASRYPQVKLFINDKDYWVSSFWKVVSDRCPKALLSLLKLMEQHPTLEQFYKLKETAPSNDIEAAYRAIFFNRTTFSGILTSGPIGGKDQASKYPIDCRWNYDKLRAKIMKCHDLLVERTEVTCKDFKNCYALTSSCYATYIDPPYFIKGDMLYPEKMSEQDHTDLAKILQSRPNWILSYDDCPEIRNLYKNNKIEDLATRYCINGKKDTWARKNELIILP